MHRFTIRLPKILARNSQKPVSLPSLKNPRAEKLAEKLGLRLDIPLGLLRRLLLRATDLVRSRLLASAPPENQEKIQRALASIADEVGRPAINPRDFVRADSVVLELNRRGKLTEGVLAEFVRERQYEEMTATLALFCGVKTNLIQRLLKNVPHDAVILACKAAKLHWPTVRVILEARFTHHSPSDQELLHAKDAFIELSQAAPDRLQRSSFITVSTLSPTLAIASSISAWVEPKCLHQCRTKSLVERSTRCLSGFEEVEINAIVPEIFNLKRKPLGLAWVHSYLAIRDVANSRPILLKDRDQIR